MPLRTLYKYETRRRCDVYEITGFRSPDTEEEILRLRISCVLSWTHGSLESTLVGPE